jgi:hypothetical protein
VCVGMMESEYRTVALPRMSALIHHAHPGRERSPEGVG